LAAKFNFAGPSVETLNAYHTKRQLHWTIGVSSQAAFIAAVVGTTFAI
jgi:hypothetical protein